MKYKKYIILSVAAIIVLALIICLVIVNQQNEKNNQIQNEVQNEIENQDEVEEENVIYEPQEDIAINKNEVAYQQNTTVDELKQEVGATGNTSIYDVSTEYDGRQILTVKPSVQFSTVLAGILDNKQPENNLESLEQKGSHFQGKKGIWIAENYRQDFQNLLKQTTKNTYTINSDGYLTCKENNNANETDKKIKQILDGNSMYIISMAGKCYILDEISGEIQEYPFEKMDPYQTNESYESGNQKIYVLTSNEAGKLSAQEIINSIF